MTEATQPTTRPRRRWWLWVSVGHRSPRRPGRRSEPHQLALLRVVAGRRHTGGSADRGALPRYPPHPRCGAPDRCPALPGDVARLSARSLELRHLSSAGRRGAGSGDAAGAARGPGLPRDGPVAGRRESGRPQPAGLLGRRARRRCADLRRPARHPCGQRPSRGRDRHRRGDDPHARRLCPDRGAPGISARGFSSPYPSKNRR